MKDKRKVIKKDIKDKGTESKLIELMDKMKQIEGRLYRLEDKVKKPKYLSCSGPL